MFCQLCGSKLQEKEIANEGYIPYCSKCDQLFFPKVNIAMIAILTNSQNEICLIEQNNLSKFKVLLAGYIKPGETLENCVRREIQEEVGIEVHKTTYLKSHFYDRKGVLMVGYHAETLNHDFNIDKNEIDNATWYHKDDALHRIREGSIAYQLVKEFLT